MPSFSIASYTQVVVQNSNKVGKDVSRIMYLDNAKAINYFGLHAAKSSSLLWAGYDASSLRAPTVQ